MNQQWTSNSAYDLTPVHGRTNNVIRVDSVFTEKTRMALRFVKDRDDDWSWNRITPGTGFVNQNTPGLLIASTISQVLKPTVVNEIGFGYTHNRWGFKAADDFDYTSLYRSALGVDPPRFEPFAQLFGSAVDLRDWRAGGRVALCAPLHTAGRQPRRAWQGVPHVWTNRFPAST